MLNKTVSFVLEQTIMTDAIVLAFPIQTIRQRDEDRLDQALSSLQASLSEQKLSLSKWQFAMTEFGIGVAGLGHALTTFQDNLGIIDMQLCGLHADVVERDLATAGVK